MSDHEQTLRALADYYAGHADHAERHAACLSGADALVLAKQTCGNCQHFADERESVGCATTGYCTAPSGNFYSGRVMESSARCSAWATREA